MSTAVKITFVTGAGTVTGANFLVEGGGKKFLIDCGLVQSEKLADDLNWDPFPYKASEIDALFVTHSHIDHIGRIPKLIHDGFKGKIFSSIPTKDLTEVMLEDTNSILSHERELGLDLIYTEKNLNTIMSLWETHDYHEPFIFGDFSVNLKDAGHILGSAMYEFTLAGKKIVFTGDLGNTPTPILKDTESIEGADYVIMESVYGDRNHEPKDERIRKLESVIKETFSRGGTVVIPAFSLERTQVILYEINKLIESKSIPNIPVYVDSPLATKITDIYKSSTHLFNTKAQEEIRNGDDIFDFPKLSFTVSGEASRSIDHIKTPKIIIAGSGMSVGGRVVHHEEIYLPDPKNTILLVGYQTLGSVGRHLMDGEKKIQIHGNEISVKAKIETILGYSSHKDSDNLVDFVARTQKTVKNVFVVMGEPKASLYLVQKIKDYLGLNAVYPERLKKYKLW
jgi:metallo-beta-lactamase family protein